MDRVLQFASQGFSNGERFRLAAVSDRGLAEPVLSLSLAGAEVVACEARRLDLAPLDELPARPLDRPPAPSLVMKQGVEEKHDDGTVTTRPERLLALDLERGVGLTGHAHLHQW